MSDWRHVIFVVVAGLLHSFMDGRVHWNMPLVVEERGGGRRSGRLMREWAGVMMPRFAEYTISDETPLFPRWFRRAYKADCFLYRTSYFMVIFFWTCIHFRFFGTWHLLLWLKNVDSDFLIIIHQHSFFDAEYVWSVLWAWNLKQKMSYDMIFILFYVMKLWDLTVPNTHERRIDRRSRSISNPQSIVLKYQAADLTKRPLNAWRYQTSNA
jgi:hypothetical protein